MTFVVDASAAIEVFRRTSAGLEVEERIDAEESYAPELFDAEALAVLSKLERRGALVSADAQASVDALRAMPVTRVSHASLIADAWSLRANLSAYDALYVALARALGCELLTADAAIARAPRLGIDVKLVVPDPPA